MSSMIPMPPRQIPLGGPAVPPGAGGPAGPSRGGDGPDSEQVRKLVSQAVDLIRQAEDLEGDDGDKALLAKAAADLRGFVGNQQKMLDTAMGAGPGVKIMRKNAPPSGGPGGGY